jgi:hypothetical protein
MHGWALVRPMARAFAERGIAAMLALVTVFVLAPTGARAAIGSHLGSISPSGPGGNGRAVEVRPGTSTGYVTAEGSGSAIYRIDMHDGASAGALQTNLETVCGCQSYGFGALAWQPGSGVLWGSEYTEAGSIVKIDPSSGTVTRVFDASVSDPLDTGIDGLAVASDRTLWVSGDGVAGGPTTIDHFSFAGTLLGSFTVPFGNSGIALDGGHLWLADYGNARIVEYTSSGQPVPGMSFPTTGTPDPEDLAIDNCTFKGKKVIWAYSADIGGQIGAYQIGSSDNSGCRESHRGGGGGSGPRSVVVGSGGFGIAGRPVTLSATSRSDPSGKVLIYIWIFGDAGHRAVPAPGKVHHTYDCPGFYPLVVTVENRSHRVIARLHRLVIVQFAPDATRTVSGRKMRPVAVLYGRRLSFYLSTLRVRRGAARITGVDWWLDGVKLHARSAGSRVRYLLGRRRGEYQLRLAVHLNHAPTVVIRSCLFA